MLVQPFEGKTSEQAWGTAIGPKVSLKFPLPLFFLVFVYFLLARLLIYTEWFCCGFPRRRAKEQCS